MQENFSVDRNAIQSQTIDLLRFPLALLVLFVHIVPITQNPNTADFSIFSWHGVYNSIGLLILNGLAAVPIFFLISGYLFFANFREWSWNGYQKKIKSRIRTLVIPYIIWNLLAFLLTVLNIWVKGEDSWGFFHNNLYNFLWDCNDWEHVQFSWLPWETYLTGPFDLPLWFLRDLIVIVFLSPVIYWFVKKTKIGGILLLFLAYMSNFWVTWHGFSILAYFYFTLGAFFALNGNNMVFFARKYKYVFFVLYIFSFSAYVYYYKADTDMSGIFRQLFIVFAVFSALSVASLLVEKKIVLPNKLLVGSCFFIYAEHRCGPIGLLGLIDVLFHKLIPGESYMEDSFLLVFVPIFTALMLVGMYWILKRYMPTIAGLLSGNR